MTMLALAGIWLALHQPQRSGRWLAVASAFYGLAVAARPSLLFGAIILLAPVVQSWREKRHAWPLLIAVIIPFGIVGLGLMFYNTLRFDNPLEFGWHYQLAEPRQDTIEQFSWRYLWFNFRVAFLEPAHWSSHFPFVSDIVAPPLPKGAFGSEHSFGVLTNTPLVWLAFVAPLAWRNRPAQVRSTLRWFLGVLTLLFGSCALIIGFYFAMCLRYEVEFTHTLVWLAVIGIIGLERALAGRPVWRWSARCGWGLLLTFSVAFNLFASFELQASTNLDIGNALMAMGRTDEAIRQFQNILLLNPYYAKARDNLGLALFRKGNVDGAIVQYQKALQINPDNATAQNNLGNAYFQEGNMEEAIVHYQKALAIKPDYLEAQNILAWILATAPQASLRDGNKAVELAQQANELTGGNNPTILCTLAAAYAEAGRFDDAIQNAKKAMALEQAAGQSSLAEQINDQLKLYEAGIPFHQEDR
jgi:tetratricopeptide (TPR) repeat protein